MNPWQIEKQLAYLLAAQVWPDSPGAKILAGGARVSERRARDLVGELTAPFALVRRVGAVEDLEAPDRFAEAFFEAEVAVENWTDLYGTSSVIGGSRESVGQSGGRGADEVLDQLRALLSTFTESTHGFQGVAVEAREHERREDGTSWIFSTFRIRVFSARSTRFYHGVLKAKATGGAGQVALTWTLPPDRFDRLRVIVRRSASGGSAPTTSTDGTGVTLSSDTATSVTVSLAAGTYAFSIFVAYDESRETPSTEERYSAAVSLSGTAS